MKVLPDPTAVSMDALNERVPMAGYSVCEGDFHSLEKEWLDLLESAVIDNIFLTPYWIAAWWRNLGDGELCLLAIRQGGRLVAVAPLVRRDSVFALAADRDVCDYADIIVRKGEERGAVAVLFDYLAGRGGSFCFSSLLPRSPLLEYLEPLARERGYDTAVEPMTPSMCLPLPQSWEEYLEQLSGKQRHEIRRKLRRLYAAGRVEFSTVPANETHIEQFLTLFRISRQDKAAFLSPQREAFFRCLMKELEARGYLRLYFLFISGHPIAALLCFDYRDTLYLYNNGFDPQYSALSPGVMSKVLCIQDAIRCGKKVFDFLCGTETYKVHLGGTAVPLFQISGKPLSQEAGRGRNLEA